MVGALGSVVVSMSSMYVALRMGALPWPTVFAALFSMFLLKPFRASLHDINVSHTAVSAGGLVAGGLAFTIPAIWIRGEDLPSWMIFTSAAIGAVLGVGMTISTRKVYVEELDLPFPMGIAAYETIKAGDEGGKKAKILFGSMGASAVFTYLRDGLGWIPVIYKGFGMFPMAVGIGFIIGVLPTMSWFAGGLVQAIFKANWLKDLGLGMMIGGGLGMALSGVKGGKISVGKTDVIVSAIVFVLSLISGIDLISSILFSVLSIIMVHLAGVVDGSTGIDPMEVFSIITITIIWLILKNSPVELVFIASIIAVATGLAGDSLQDMKTGKLLGTNPKAQIIAEGIGAAVGVFVASALLIAIHQKYGSAAFGTTFPVPQAMSVSKFLSGGNLSTSLIVGIIISGILQYFKIPSLTFGIGLYLPLFITLPVALGGALRIIVNKFAPEKVENWSVAASGLLGGEGITGIILGLIRPV